MRNFNEIFMKDVTYDHIKSRKKARLYPLFRRYIFGKNTEEGGGGGPHRDPSPLQAVLALNPEAAVQRCSENF